MLVHRMDCHALRRRSGGLGQSLPEHIMALVADPNPVDRTQNNRFAGTQQNHATTAQTEFPLRLDRVIGHHAAHGGVTSTSNTANRRPSGRGVVAATKGPARQASTSSRPTT